MRTLNLYEIKEKIASKSSEISYTDPEFLEAKIVQFWNFLNEQPITKNIISRIENYYSDMKAKIDSYYADPDIHKKKEVENSLISDELQGAFGYFLIKHHIITDKKRKDPTNLSYEWLSMRRYRSEAKDDFIDRIFNPFIELLDYYLTESKSENINDYFSEAESEELINKINSIIDKLEELSLGQEVIFNELDDLKNNISTLNKKNWLQLLKGKPFDFTIQRMMDPDTINLIYSSITGSDLKFLT